MKTVFSVKSDIREFFYSCVAGSESQALEETLEYATNLGILPLIDLKVDAEGVFSDFSDFLTRYSIRNNPHDPMAGLGGKLFGWSSAEWIEILRSDESTVWTLIENDELWWICPGIHTVNRLGYLLSDNPRRGDEPNYLYE